MGINHHVVFSPVLGSLRTRTRLFSSLSTVLDGQTDPHGAVSAVPAAVFTPKVPKGYTLCGKDQCVSPNINRGSGPDSKSPAFLKELTAPKEGHACTGVCLPPPESGHCVLWGRHRGDVEGRTETGPPTGEGRLTIPGAAADPGDWGHRRAVGQGIPVCGATGWGWLEWKPEEADFLKIGGGAYMCALSKYLIFKYYLSKYLDF